MNETNPPSTTPYPPAPVARAGDSAAHILAILSVDLINLIKSTSDQLIPLRGIIRQQLNLAVPKDLFTPGNGQAILDWIAAHYKPPAHKITAAPNAPPDTVPVEVEFNAYVSGTVSFSRRDYYKGIIHIPRDQLTDCEDEDELQDAISRYVSSYGASNMDVETYGETDYGDCGEEDAEVDRDDVEINTDTTALLRTLNP